LGSSLIRHLDLATCGCFGAESLSPSQTIWMDVVLVAISLWLAARKSDRQAWSLENL